MTPVELVRAEMLTPFVESPVGNVVREAAVFASHRRSSIAEGEAIGSYELVELMGRGEWGRSGARVTAGSRAARRSSS